MAVGALIQLFGARILNVRPLLMIGMVEEDFVQASAMKDFATFCAPREVLFFVGRLIFVLVRFHEPIAHSLCHPIIVPTRPPDVCLGLLKRLFKRPAAGSTPCQRNQTQLPRWPQ